MGMNVRVYRDASADLEGNTVSKKFDTLCIINVPGPFSPSEDKPAAVLIRQETGNVILVPQELLDSGKWFTSSGNYAYSSDHRFTDTVETMSGYPYAFPVPIHDRVE